MAFRESRGAVGLTWCDQQELYAVVATVFIETSFARDWRAFNLSLRKAPFANARFSAVMCVMKFFAMCVMKKKEKRKKGNKIEKALARFSVERALY